MTSLLEHLGKDTLPEPILKVFAQWCVLKQARPALASVLQKANMSDIATSIEKTDDTVKLAELSKRANEIAKEARNKTGPLTLSAAEAAAFEFNNLANEVNQAEMDAEAVSFFSARVCGWAGWAEADNFADIGAKSEAEANAKNAQEKHLEQLWTQHGSHKP